MPIKEKKVHISDPPWITAELKHLIKLRQRAFHNKHLDSYRHYRNLVYTERKKCRSRFFSSKIKHLKETKPSLWWKEVRQISGMDTASRAEKLLDHLQLDLMAIDSPKTIANRINEALLNPLARDRTTSANETYDIDEESSNHPLVVLTQEEVYNTLCKLNPRKAPGPDGIPNWILRDYAVFLAKPITTILNSSYQNKEIPTAWKYANVTPIPKQKPVTNVNKHLRPISLTQR